MKNAPIVPGTAVDTPFLASTEPNQRIRTLGGYDTKTGGIVEKMKGSIDIPVRTDYSIINISRA